MPPYIHTHIWLNEWASPQWVPWAPTITNLEIQIKIIYICLTLTEDLGVNGSAWGNQDCSIARAFVVGVLKCQEYQVVSGGSYLYRALSGYQGMTTFGQLHKQMWFFGTRCSVSKLSIKNAACFRSGCFPRPLWNEMLGCRSKTASQRKDSEWINYLLVCLHKLEPI